MRYAYLIIALIVLGSAAFFMLHKRQESEKKVPLVVCTTTIIADAVAAIAGSDLRVETLMGPGVDPHLYRARESDIALLSNADLIFYNGLHLEGKMADIFTHLADYIPTIALAETLPSNALINAEIGHIPDPHVWHDVELYKQFIPIIVRALSSIDPDHAYDFVVRAAEYSQKLDLLDRYVREQIALIPIERRALVTAHDAFSYFGKRYNMHVIGLQGMSTDAQLTAQDMYDAIDVVINAAVPAIFLESSIPAQSINALQHALQMQGHAVTIGDELYSDSLGDQGTTAGTYFGMIKHNVDSIVAALAR